MSGILAIALAPAILILIYFYKQDKHEKEPVKYILISALLGALTIIPAATMELAVDENGLNANYPTGRLFFYAVFVVGFAEEFFKFLVLRFYMYRHKEFDEPYDGIIYGVAVGMGFAAVENIMYVAQGGLSVGLLRMFTAVPGHAIFGVILGYYTGLAKFKEKRGARTGLIFFGFVLAMLTHGLYDFFLVYDESALFFFSFLILIFGIILSRKAIKLHQKSSPFIDNPKQKNENISKKNVPLKVESNNLETLKNEAQINDEIKSNTDLEKPDDSDTQEPIDDNPQKNGR